MVSKKMMEILRKRDRDVCAYSGVSSERLVPHHRSNRGMGGAKSKDVLSNLVLVDSLLNGRFEDDLQQRARDYGFKISRYAEPSSIPLWHMGYGEWVLLDDEGTVRILDGIPKN